ncbi:MAG: ABC transporter permease subunit [Acidobacteriia bacterium]|nr:ABC transporter permease subunit [Terriglobia bacterium]
MAFFYGVLSFGRYWIGPVSTQAEIDLHPAALPKYALYSVLRITIAYGFSLGFTLIYGYVAAYNRKAERFMIPLLDTLQSIPVLSFLPGVMISMVALFPTRQLGVELGCVLLIFTGQVWNMTFSFYSSLKNIPREMYEAAQVYRLSWWQRFRQLELPYAAIGLIWNSMMSVAGGWFFLMACEMFVLGNRDLRLPGLGSYLQTAANAGNTRAILAGLAVMVGVIVLIDRVVWRPVIAWAEKFKFEQVEAAETPRSPILDLLRRSRVLSLAARKSVMPIREALDLHFARAHASAPTPGKRLASRWTARMVGVVALGGIAYAVVKMLSVAASVSWSDLRTIFLGAGATFLRVEFVLVLAALWTIPVGTVIGLHPKLSAIAQPIAQIAASVPATALFPIILLVLIRWGGGLGIGSIVLLLLGTQWYMLFNVIAGATAIPTDLKEVCDVYHLKRVERWRRLLLPGIFPYLVTGFVTASGGAWNASIVAEYFHFRGQTISTVGLGAVISQATDHGNFRMLLMATMVMAIIVVTINRMLWRRLYALASTRFKLES